MTDEAFLKFTFETKALKLLNLDSDYVIRHLEYGFELRHLGFSCDVSRHYILMEYCTGMRLYDF